MSRKTGSKKSPEHATLEAPGASSGANALASSSDGDQNVVLKAIEALKNDLFLKMEEKAKAQAALLKDEIAQLQSEFRAAVKRTDEKIEAASSRLADLEAGVNGQSDQITSMEADINILKKELAVLRDRCEDYEQRARRFNLRLWGIREGRETGKRTSHYVADMLKSALGMDVAPTLDIAHRTLREKPTQDGAEPRAFVMRCHYLQEKEAMLKKAAELKDLTTADGDKIRIQQDFTHAVARRRKAFTEVRGLLKGCEGVRFGIKFPATLRITTIDGRESTFDDPKAAKDFVLKKLVRNDDD